MIRALTLAALLALGAAPAMAANANQPYQNVDRSNDRGNDTGNSRVDSLNRAQSDESQGYRNPGLGTAPPSAPAAPARPQ